MEKKFKSSLVATCIFSLCLQACQTKSARPGEPSTTHQPPHENKHPGGNEVVYSSPADAVPVLAPPVQPDLEATRFGIIFSGGGVRTWSYITFLKELQKFKLPIAAVAGIEWGSVVAGLYAHGQSANEVEWELSKFKSINDWQGFIKTIFEKKSVASLKIPFGCPSLNLKNQTMYILNKGNLSSLVPFCLPSPGLMKPFTQSVAAMSEIPQLAQFLRANGANKVLLVHVLENKLPRPFVGSLESYENQIWSSSAAAVNKKNVGVDEIIEIDLSSISVDKFDARRDVLNAPLSAAKDQLTKMARKYHY